MSINHTITVLYHTETLSSFGVFVDQSPFSGGWSRLEWFPKSICTFERETTEKHLITAPEWLLKTKNIKFIKDEDKI